MENLVYGGAEDVPDERDYQAIHVLGEGDFIIPEEAKLDLVEGDQGASPLTKVACTLFAAYHACKIANMIEHGSLEPDFLKGLALQKQFGTYTTNGDSLQTALKSVLKNGFITNEGRVLPIQGYAAIKKDEVKKMIAQGYAVITIADVTKTNFNKAKTTGVWGGKDGSRVTGHAFVFTGYNANHYRASNSYGKEWGYFKDGTFLIKKEDLNSLGSCYVIYDKKDGADIFKDVTSKSPFADAIFWCKTKKIINGYGDGSYRPNQPVTRGELAQVLFNYENNRLK